MKPRITFGMAHCDDFEGLWATVQSIFLHNDWDRPGDVQIVIVDTSPIGSDARRLVQGFVEKGGNDFPGSRTKDFKYVDMAGFAGTTLPRDVIFDHADAPFVCVMDCHVMLRKDAHRKLLDWFEANPDCQDLIHGPMIYDNLHAMSTHFADQFRGGMWGTWGQAWLSPEGQVFVCEKEEVTDENRERHSDGNVHYHDLMTLDEFPSDPEGTTTCRFPSGELFPADIRWESHELRLEALGCKRLAESDTEEPFDIPGCGMGLFASRKDSWLRFAKDCTGFGGEEMNIHARYKAAGRRTICLPFVKWNHRFGRAGGAPYPLPTSAKVRNYALWAEQNGNPKFKDRVTGEEITTLDRVYTHFVKGGHFEEENWAKLIADPKGYKVVLKMPDRSSGMPTLDTLFMEVAAKARDLNEHAETIRSYAGQVGSIRGFVKRCDWETLLVAGYPSTLETFQAEEGDLIARTHAALKGQMAKDNRKVMAYNTHHGDEVVDPLVIEPADVDMLVIDRDNSAEYLSAVLERHGASARYMIMIRGTQAFGERAEFDASKPGMFQAIREWIEKHPDWFVMDHRPNQYGLTVLGRDPVKRPEKPIRMWPKGYGPGTELKTMLSDVGISPPDNCSCRTTMLEMDELGPEGCRLNRDEIIKRIEENAEKWGWGKLSTMHSLAGVGIKSMLSGLAWKVNWLDPFPGLVDEAIRRAEVAEAAVCTKECKPEGCAKPNCKKKKQGVGK